MYKVNIPDDDDSPLPEAIPVMKFEWRMKGRVWHAQHFTLIEESLVKTRMQRTWLLGPDGS